MLWSEREGTTGAWIHSSCSTFDPRLGPFVTHSILSGVLISLRLHVARQDRLVLSTPHRLSYNHPLPLLSVKLEPSLFLLPNFVSYKMAADDYYNGSLPDQYNEPTRQENHNSLPRPPSKKAPNFIYTHHPAVSPYSSNSPVSEYQSTERIPPNRDSSYYPTAAVGRLHDNDQYSDNIPLKPQLHQNPSQEDWTGENTKYPPSPESQRAGVLAPPLKSKKSRWFGARTPWFVYIVSIAQMGVFVGEIIKNGKRISLPSIA